MSDNLSNQAVIIDSSYMWLNGFTTLSIIGSATSSKYIVWVPPTWRIFWLSVLWAREVMKIKLALQMMQCCFSRDEAEIWETKAFGYLLNEHTSSLKVRAEAVNWKEEVSWRWSLVYGFSNLDNWNLFVTLEWYNIESFLNFRTLIKSISITKNS